MRSLVVAATVLWMLGAQAGAGAPATPTRPMIYPPPGGLAPSDRYAASVSAAGQPRRNSFVYISQCPRGKFKPDRVWRTLLDRTFSWAALAGRPGDG